MDFGKIGDCAQYFDGTVFPRLQNVCAGLRIVHQQGAYDALIYFEERKMYRETEYIGIRIMVIPTHNRDATEHNVYVKEPNLPTISGKLLAGDEQLDGWPPYNISDEWFFWDTLDGMVDRINDLRHRRADEKVLQLYS